ncbi:MAG: hypothetical protein AVDCRST_MAG91-3278 [uncultured Sphingomonadaceae bacterium]|uniref:Uncharacterized protein n=1 Tax=uncultured Sphingomonadaceae bacterium TaxID=169976 RepID=A0A6J4TZ79_9SPHN|nr:MAG: hypothetical protein AVDCRST_MAG91-3278 [uncultured Sphingomonadaceae bacterium]
MDMGLIKGEAEAPDAIRLDYPMLVALLGLNGGGPAPRSSPRASGSKAAYRSARMRLVAVMLGRDGWRDAARALGGRFAVLSMRGPATPRSGRQPR